MLARLHCAHGGPVGRALLRATPEDFVVRERLGFEPDGEGEHVLIKVRKRSANTLWVAQQLALAAQVDAREIGFAGLKDRDAVAEQSFTAPARSAVRDWTGLRGEGFEVLSAARHRRKLKRGALKGNEFEIVLRAFEGDAAALERRLETLAVAGVPNYFGPQRFGRDGRNLARALAWFEGASRAPARAERGFLLSAARAAVFNAVLDERVRAGTWNQLLRGDVANLDGGASIFAVSEPDATLHERASRLDLHPTGPLWGAGAAATADAVRELEERVAAEHRVLAEGLARAGLEQERRALRAPLTNLRWSIDGRDVRLSFGLPRGAFATAVLHELIDNAFTTYAPEGGD